MKRITPFALATALIVACGFAQTRPAAHNFDQWEKKIAAFEQADQTNPPPKGALLFIGSSTVARWKTLPEDFPDQQVINRGFGGSEIVDSTHFADRIIFPYEPKMILLRAGSNDLQGGKSPEQVFSDFKDFVATVHAKLPDTIVVFTGLNATPKRWNNHEKEIATNKMIEKFASETPNVKYIETYDIALDADGKPREELFVADKLHPNAEGYKLLTARIREFLKKQQ
jgi:lysophospholipase L1-like esterase